MISNVLAVASFDEILDDLSRLASASMHILPLGWLSNAQGYNYYGVLQSLHCQRT